MEVSITVIVAILSGLSFVVYKKPEIAGKLLYRTFLFWGGLMFFIMISIRLTIIELQDVIKQIEIQSIESYVDKNSIEKSKKIISEKIASYDVVYKYTFLSAFIMGAGLLGVFFFSKLLISHQKEAKKANDEPDNKPLAEQ